MSRHLTATLPSETSETLHEGSEVENQIAVDQPGKGPEIIRRGGAVRGGTELAPAVGRFESLGLKLPDTRLTTAELVASCGPDFNLDLEKLTGIRERRICAEGEDSFTLAVDAAWDCLAYSSHRARDIEMLISCSITKYKGGLSYSFEPAFSLLIKEAIGASQAINFDVSNACAGMMTGVSILNDFIRRGAVRCGMVVSGEYISSISDNATRAVGRGQIQQLASLTVGDSGAAVILERAPSGSEGISACEFVTVAEHSDLCIGKACETAPGATMLTDAGRLHSAAIEAAVPTIQKALSKSGLRFDQIDHAIPHQTSERSIRTGIRQATKEIGSVARNVVYNVEEYGNTASTTHFVALYKLLHERRFEVGNRILLACYASGIVVGAMIFTMDELVEKYGRDH